MTCPGMPGDFLSSPCTLDLLKSIFVLLSFIYLWSALWIKLSWASHPRGTSRAGATASDLSENWQVDNCWTGSRWTVCGSHCVLGCVGRWPLSPQGRVLSAVQPQRVQSRLCLSPVRFLLCLSVAHCVVLEVWKIVSGQ